MKVLQMTELFVLLKRSSTAAALNLLPNLEKKIETLTIVRSDSLHKVRTASAFTNRLV